MMGYTLMTLIMIIFAQPLIFISQKINLQKINHSLTIIKSNEDFEVARAKLEVQG
jgi:hypothetical protein